MRVAPFNGNINTSCGAPAYSRLQTTSPIPDSTLLPYHCLHKTNIYSTAQFSPVLPIGFLYPTRAITHGEGRGGETKSPPLQTDPKRYILPTHRVRRCACRLLRDVREGGSRVWYCYKRYDKNFNTGSILKFVCRSSPDHANYLTWSVPCCQFYFRRWCPFEPPAGSERATCTPPPTEGTVIEDSGR